MILKHTIFIFFLLAGISISASAASDQVVINSADWQDVYLGAYFASLNDINAKFLVNSEHAATLLHTLDKNKKNILLIESNNTPFVFSFRTNLESAGFTVEELISSGTSLNLELSKRANLKNFIIVSDTYGYDAISVAPYALQEKFFVLFTNKENIDEIYSFLKANGVDKMILYGIMDFEVSTRLAEFNPIVINKGSRFDNNIELLKRYKNIQKIIFTNGEFIEEGIMSGRDPVLFLGRQRVPDKVIEYIRGSNIKTGVIIGNKLSEAAKQLKDATNMSIFVKFGQGFASGGNSEITALDMFPLPKYDLAIDINSVKYNRASNELEVTYENKGNVGAYLSSSIEIVSSGVRITTIGDRDSVYVIRGGTLTVPYKVELSGQNLTAKFTTMFGEVPRSFELILNKEMNIEMIEILDNSLLNISKVSYDKSSHKIKVQITNTGGVKTYSKTQIKFLVYGEERIMVQDKAMLLEPGASKDAVFITTLSDTNIEENPMINVRANYGERESALIKVIEGNFPVEIVSDYTMLIIVFVLIIGLIIIWVQKKKKQKKDIEKSNENSTGVPESTTVLDPTESMTVPDPTESTTVPDPAESTTVLDPAESTTVPDPTESTTVPDPTESTTVLDPTGSTVVPDPTGSTVVPDDKEKTKNT